MAEGDARRISRADATALGLKRYFVGTACPHGHIAERYVSSRLCVTCCAQRKAAWANSNREKVAEYNVAHYAKNRDAACERSRLWRRTNPAQYKRQKTRHYLKHRDRYRERFRAYNAKNKESVRDSHRRKASENPERYAAYKRNRRARKRNALGSHSAEDVARILRDQKGKCAGCRTNLRSTKRHVDHIVALANGGTNWPKNLQLLCASCNHSKSARDPIDFMQARGHLL